MTVSQKGPIRVLIADDHAIVREGIGSFLSKQSHVKVVAEAEDGQEAVRKAERLRPDVILLDLNMPRMNGLGALELLRERLPSCRILIVTMHESREYVAEMIRAGAHGYILKDSSPTDLLRAIECVHAGNAFFSPAVARFLIDTTPPQACSDPDREYLLSEREKDVLTLVAEGYSSREIAFHLRIGVRTVETHREQLVKKLRIATVAGLTKFAVAHGFASLSPTPLRPRFNLRDAPPENP